MIHEKMFFALLVILIPGAILATQAPENCAKLTEADTRLACYDSIFGPSIPNKERVDEQAIDTQKPPEHWSVRETVSKIDDSNNVFLGTNALDTNRGRYGREVRLSLWTACRENSTSVWINFGGHFMSDYEHGTVIYRVDKQDAKRKKFRESNDHEALGLWSGGSSIPFLKQLPGHDRLYIRATPHSESALEAVFRACRVKLNSPDRLNALCFANAASTCLVNT